MAKEDEMKERVTKEMDALGYVPASAEGFSEDFLMWKPKEGMEEEFGFDGWEMTEKFVNNVKELQEKYTLQELFDRKNGDYSKIGFSDYTGTEIDNAIRIQQRENIQKQLTEMVDGNKKAASRPLKIGNTMNVLVLCGADGNLPITITKKVIDKAMRPEIRDENGRLSGKTGHGLTQEQIVQTQEELKNPVMLFRGAHENSLLAITSVKDDKERNIVISIDLNKQEGFGYANSVTSIYGRDNLERYIEKNTDNDNLLAVNTNKADKMLHSIGKSYPKENTFISFDDSIAYTMENVNNKNENISEISEKNELTHGEEVIEKNNSIEAEKSIEEQRSEALYKGITSVMDSTEFKNYCDTMNKLMYNNYSGRNCLNIMSQWIQRYCDGKGIDLTKLSEKELREKVSEALNSKDKPTYLMGYEAWKQYGRQVTGKGVAYEIVVPNMVNEKEGKGSLLKAIKKSFEEQFAKDASLEYAHYQLGRTKLGFNGYKNGLIDILHDGKVIRGKQTEETVRRFIDTQIVGKVPNGYSTSFVYDVKNTVVPEHLWVKNGFRKEELVLDGNGEPVTRKPYKNSKMTEYKIVNTEERKNRFKPHISQDIVQLDEGKTGVLFDVLKNVSEGKGVPMSAEPIAAAGTKGFFSHKDNRIVIKDELSATEKCAVAFHEMAHADMHYQRSDLSREMKEVQAEAVAYMTAQNFGIETSTSSFNYIAVWSSGRDVKELESSMGEILNQSKKLFREISAELNERGLTINLEPVRQETFAKKEIEEFIKDNKQFVLDETRAANELKDAAVKQLETTTDERCSNIIKEQIVVCNDTVRTLNAADKALHELEQASDAETAKKLMGNANKAYSQVLEMKEKFSGLSDELAERMQEMKESGKMTVLEKYMEKPVETMKEYIRDADARNDLESGFKESLKNLTDKDLTYIARSQYLSGNLHKTADSDLTAFMKKAVEQVKNVNGVKAKNGSFVEISLCEQWTKNPVFKEGTVAHPKTANQIFGEAEKEMRGKKREAQKEGNYFPYTKCHLTVFTEHGNHLFATETRIDIGDGEQKNLSDHLKQCCRDGSVLEAYGKAVRENVQDKLLEPSDPSEPAAERPAAGQTEEKGNPDGGAIGMDELKESIGQAKPSESQTREARNQEKEKERG